MKKKGCLKALPLLLMLAAALLFTGAKAQAATLAQGICGNELEWELSDKGKLTITGTGDMTDFPGYDAQPWAAYRTRISSLSIASGVTSVGQYAFYGCSSLSSLSVASGLMSVGVDAFQDCTSLRHVVLPRTVTYIGNGAFYGCDLLTFRALGVISIGDRAFWPSDTAEAPVVLTFSALRTIVRADDWYGRSGSFNRGNYVVYFYGTAEDLNNVALNCLRGTITSYAIPYPKLTTQPKAQSVLEGQDATFSVEATGRSLSYQWQYSKDGKTWSNWSRGKKSITVAAVVARNGYSFRCKVTDVAGTVLTSKAVKLTVKSNRPVIDTHPKTVNCYLNGTANYSVTASGTGLSYRWQFSADGGKSWKTWSTKGNSISVKAEANRDGYQFRCVVKNAAGKTTNSTAAKLNILTKIVTQPKSVSVTEGGTASFKVTATGIPKLSYRWYVSKDGGSTWSYYKAGRSISFQATAARNGWRFRCEVTAGNGRRVTTNAVKLTVK